MVLSLFVRVPLSLEITLSPLCEWCVGGGGRVRNECVGLGCGGSVGERKGWVCGDGMWGDEREYFSNIADALSSSSSPLFSFLPSLFLLLLLLPYSIPSQARRKVQSLSYPHQVGGWKDQVLPDWPDVLWLHLWPHRLLQGKGGGEEGGRRKEKRTLSMNLSKKERSEWVNSLSTWHSIFFDEFPT